MQLINNIPIRILKFVLRSKVVQEGMNTEVLLENDSINILKSPVCCCCLIVLTNSHYFSEAELLGVSVTNNITTNNNHYQLFTKCASFHLLESCSILSILLLRLL